MFRSKSFSQVAFSPLSWRFDTPPVGVTIPPYATRSTHPKKRRKRRLADDALVLTLLLHEFS